MKNEAPDKTGSKTGSEAKPLSVFDSQRARHNACGRSKPGHDWTHDATFGLSGRTRSGGWRTAARQRCARCGKTRVLMTSGDTGRTYVRSR